MLTVKIIGLILAITGLGLAITSLWLNLKRIDNLEWRFIETSESQFEINEMIRDRLEQLELKKKRIKQCK